MESYEYYIAYCTVPTQDVADSLADTLLNSKRVACVNIVPGIKSKYWWDGKVQTNQELLLVMKTRKILVPELVETVKSNHPYSVPEVITVPITAGNPAYLEWLDQNTKLPINYI